LAYRFDSKFGSFCYTGDTGPDAGLAKFAQGVDCFVLECSLSDRKKNENHLQVSQALALFKASGAKKGLLSHLSPDSSTEAARKIRRFPGVRLAEDLMRLKIG
jgi:ribonuclease BN (tRNA processing enzyme)